MGYRRGISALLAAFTVAAGIATGGLAVAEDNHFEHEDSYRFPELSTPDGTAVQYVPLSAEQMDAAGHSVAYAVHDRSGAYIYYDYELFARLPVLAKAQIIEHEGAHHTLGHTLSTRMFRESATYVPADLTYRKETDADCESGFRLAETFDIDAGAIKEAMVEIYLQSGGDADNYPEWLPSRIDKVITCFNGVLLPRPQPLENAAPDVEPAYHGNSSPRFHPVPPRV